MRQEDFRHWVQAALTAGKLCPDPVPVLVPINGDAGFRHYYRISGSLPSLLAPPTTEKNEEFCHIARLLRQHGIHAPQVYAADYQQGFMLIEDLGSEIYWPLLQAGKQEVLYAEATHCLLKMHRIPIVDVGLSSHDAEKLRQEMALFPEWFVSRLLGMTLSREDRHLLDVLFEQLIVCALRQPQVVVHRDFHCRNLIRTAHNSPGVIDFQDGVVGPITYDLVSLYRDCYIHWPKSQVRRWVEQYRCDLVQHGLLEKVTAEQFLLWFDWMGLQRHIKVLGIFARLYLRDNKAGYLNDLPLVMAYTLSVARQYPGFVDFATWFEQVLLPHVRQCDWYRDVQLVE